MTNPSSSRVTRRTKPSPLPSERARPLAANGNLADLTLADLKAKAKEAGIKGYSTMKKAEIIEALEK